MSYFDHVRCSSCGASLDPESLGGVRALRCPKCGADLAVTDLFGLGAAFAEDEEPPLTLDDAVPGASSSPPERPRANASSGARDPAPPGARPAGLLPGAAGPARRGAATPPSALDLMRELKGKKK